MTLNFDTIRPLFRGLSQAQVDGINLLVATFARLGDRDPRHLAYVLATAKHETDATMQPIREYGLGRGKPYGVVDSTGKAPYGRGYVQLTWARNYQLADAKLGLRGRLAANYDLALDPSIAASVLIRGSLEGWFTGRRLADYPDYVNMRRVINGLDRADLVALYANTFERALH